MFDISIFLWGVGLFLFALTFFMTYYGGAWAKTVKDFLFAGQRLKVVETSMAIGSHWIWAIALFVGPIIAYNWGVIGALTFIIPNALSVVLVGFLAYRFRDLIPSNFSITNFIGNEYSERTAWLYRSVFLTVCFAGVIFAFTAINKFWAFAGLTDIMHPLVASGIMGVVTWIYTARGGIRTGIYGGSLLTILWLLFGAVTLTSIYMSDAPMMIDNMWGKNNLQSFFDVKFLTSFAITFIIGISFAAGAHGMMWQKAFSMKKEYILPTFISAGAIFACIVGMLLYVSLWVFQTGLPIKSPDSSLIGGVSALLGPIGLMVFGVILLGQTSTVVDSILSYISSLLSTDHYNMSEESKNYGRISMGVFLLAAWMVTFSGIELWTIWIIMGILRITTIVPLAWTLFVEKLSEKTMFYSCILTTIPAIALAVSARMDKDPLLEMYAMIGAVAVPVLIFAAIKFRGMLLYINNGVERFLR